ncbi:MAG: nickel pincer cofactor biosynthesis protein LarB [Actinomycetes bacterium]|nr:nickel pincer cofactor biosynthesis protein LarB [Actinomycetes bacterium]
MNDLPATVPETPDTAELRDDSGLIDVRVDHDRAVRCGLPEVIFAQNKTPHQVARIAVELAARGDGPVLATRANEEQFAAVRELLPEAQWHALPRAITVGDLLPAQRTGLVVVASAGTADLPVAEEAALTCEVGGARVQRLYDIGIAGIHRALAHMDEMRAARVIIAVAGMEGALPSLIAGMVDVPVIAVPTSVGYGANLEGLAPLLAMLNSCAGGIGVVNIDNGFGAAVLASRINSPRWVDNSK